MEKKCWNTFNFSKTEILSKYYHELNYIKVRYDFKSKIASNERYLWNASKKEHLCFLYTFFSYLNFTLKPRKHA
jgi:hypothetical protein